MKNILLLTPIYPADDLPKESTPVVHYFTRVWASLGYNVVVMHYAKNFPHLIYTLAKPFKSFLETKNGFSIRTFKVKHREYELDGVNVCRIPMVKFKPHSRYGAKEVKRACEKTIEYCQKIEFKPDVIISHWINPCFEIMHTLKQKFYVPTCYVAHDNGVDFLSIYQNESLGYIRETDVLGFRSRHIKESFIKNFHCHDKPYFMCYSGVPEKYVSSVGDVHRDFRNVSKFIYVGTLIQRKYPAEIIPAVYSVYQNDDFSISYVGNSGRERDNIVSKASQLHCMQKVHLLGRVERGDVIELLKQSDVFVMISRNETFGLVYLEAMAVGCITIASRNEGFDGIIEDGVNGFLCEAGNVDELSEIIRKIRSMPVEDLSIISKNAVETARKLTDVNVAKEYLDNILKIAD